MDSAYGTLPLTPEGVPAGEHLRSSDRLYTGVGWLDSVVGGFTAPEMVLIDSSGPFVFGLLSEICVQAVAEHGHEMVFVDGGNSIRPYDIARIAKLRGLEPNGVLSRINVARGFTAHQMAALINGNLDSIISETGARTVVVSSLIDLFLDPDMRWGESFQLIKRCMGKLGEVTRRHGTVSIISNFGTHKLCRSGPLFRMMSGSPDRVIRLTHEGAGMHVSLPNRGTHLHRHPVPESQTVLERYFRECSYGEDGRNL